MAKCGLLVGDRAKRKAVKRKFPLGLPQPQPFFSFCSFVFSPYPQPEGLFTEYIHCAFHVTNIPHTKKKQKNNGKLYQLAFLLQA